MSYPSQPQFTPPYGQPQPPRQPNNLWIAGTSVIVVLIIVMTVTLLVVQRTSDSNSGGSGADPTSQEQTGEEPTEDEPTEDEPTRDEPTEDEPTGGSGGFEEATCGTFDFTAFNELFGMERDPEEDYTSASTSGGSGSLNCTFYTEEYDSSNIRVQSYDDADFAHEMWSDNRDYWDNEDDYEVSDQSDLGDDAYLVVFGDTGAQKRAVELVSGSLSIEVDVWVYVGDHDAAVADDYLVNMAEQSLAMFADYA